MKALVVEDETRIAQLIAMGLREQGWTVDVENRGDAVVPAQMRAEVIRGEDGEDRQRDDFLNYFELHGRETAITDTVRGHLEAVLEEGNAPTDDDYLPQLLLPIFQVAVPGNGHKDVGADEEHDGPHLYLGYAREGLGWE